jgi:hypothetical protein
MAPVLHGTLGPMLLPGFFVPVLVRFLAHSRQDQISAAPYLQPKMRRIGTFMHAALQ